jgi:hypothetical protein
MTGIKEKQLVPKELWCTFAIVISAQYNNDILEQRNKREGPEYQGKYTEYCLFILVLTEPS